LPPDPLPCYPSAHLALGAAPEDSPVAVSATSAASTALRRVTTFVRVTNVLSLGLTVVLGLLLLSRP
jgi:hypothetical protein